MRVIAGEARRLLLKTLPGEETRPTTDKIKETLFNIIHFDLPGCRFLDLFAGSGGIGIEALSRGASQCIFCDNNPKATAVIRENLVHTGLDHRAQVYTGDALGIVRRLSASGEAPFDFIFLDPPYEMGLEDGVLRVLKNAPMLNDETRIILELSLKTEIEHFRDFGYDILKVKEYKSNKHVFLRRT